MTRLSVRFRVPAPGGVGREFEVGGQTARTLLALGAIQKFELGTESGGDAE